MFFSSCQPLRIYVILLILFILLACIINVFVDYFNNVGILYSVTKNIIGSICWSLCCIVLVIIFFYICSYPVGQLVIWAFVLLFLLCCSSAVMGNFFYVYSWNPIIV